MARSMFSLLLARIRSGIWGIESHGRAKNQNLLPRFNAGDQALMGAIGRKKRRACYG